MQIIELESWLLFTYSDGWYEFIETLKYIFCNKTWLTHLLVIKIGNDWKLKFFFNPYKHMITECLLHGKFSVRCEEM